MDCVGLTWIILNYSKSLNTVQLIQAVFSRLTNRLVDRFRSRFIFHVGKTCFKKSSAVANLPFLGELTNPLILRVSAAARNEGSRALGKLTLPV